MLHSYDIVELTEFFTENLKDTIFRAGMYFGP